VLHSALAALLVLLGTQAAGAFESRPYIEKATDLIEEGRHTLARTYLDPALIDYRLTRGERSRAYYLRGYSFFSQGLYVSARKDYNRALEFYPDNPIVLSALGHLHFDGLGVPRDQALASELFRKAAEAGYAPAQTRLGHTYLTGAGLDQDVSEARRWLERAAEAGDALAMRQLGASFRAPFAETPAPQTALAWYERAWQAGDSEAPAYIGFMLESGELASAAEDARHYFELSAEAGSALGQAKLAHLYLSAPDAEANPDAARRLFEAAAAQGHPAGYLGMAYLYESGTALAQDPEAALAWYRKAAEAGSADAQLRLAHQALQNKDLEGQLEARSWFERAAATDSPRAWNDYAWLLATSPFDEIRQGMRAVALAERATARERSPSYLDTLAAAYAEIGNFEQAIALQKEALAGVKEQDSALAAELRSHLEAFQAGEPWRE
jgi:TPR repeat protein